MFREYTSSDAKAIAHHYNLNFDRDDNIWCADGSPTNSSKIKLHAKSLSIRGIRLTQVHDEDGVFLSYFGGYLKGNGAVFKIAVVNLEVPDPQTLFRKDGAHALLQALQQGVEHVILSGSSDRAFYATWAEQEVGMNRDTSRSLWVADKDTVNQYISTTFH